MTDPGPDYWLALARRAEAAGADPAYVAKQRRRAMRAPAAPGVPVARPALDHLRSPEHYRSRLRAAALARSCPYREPCGCTYARCHRDGRELPKSECTDCAGRMAYFSLPAPGSTG